LGSVQKQWLKDSLADSSAAIKFIITSVPFSDPRTDKWGQFPQERDDILDLIDKRGIAGVVFSRLTCILQESQKFLVLWD